MLERREILESVGPRGRIYLMDSIGNTGFLK